ncbi:unnamed protein product [Tenebrio molitor]|nr:unnamed protein product [Tenebrio molitor]
MDADSNPTFNKIPGALVVGQQKVRNETDQSDAVILVYDLPDMAAVSSEITSGQGKNALLKIKKLKTSSAQKF